MAWASSFEQPELAVPRGAPMGSGLPITTVGLDIPGQRGKQSPCLIYQESDVIIRAVRDYLRDDIDQVLIDDSAAYQRAADFVGMVMPRYANRLKLYETHWHSSTDSKSKAKSKPRFSARSVFPREDPSCSTRQRLWFLSTSTRKSHQRRRHRANRAANEFGGGGGNRASIKAEGHGWIGRD